jgi:hypothetical protein
MVEVVKDQFGNAYEVCKACFRLSLKEGLNIIANVDSTNGETNSNFLTISLMMATTTIILVLTSCYCYH